MEKIVKPVKSIRGLYSVPGDKSISHRALIISSLAKGDSSISGFSFAGDPTTTLNCLKQLGVEFEFRNQLIVIKGKGKHSFKQASTSLNAENSGTTIRLLSGTLAGQPFETVINGDDSLNRRPMLRIIEPLRLMGTEVFGSDSGTPPLRIIGKYPLRSIDYILPVASAQVKSAIIFAGLFSDGITYIIEPVPTRNHTEQMLGIEVQQKNCKSRIKVEGNFNPEPREYLIPGDVSSAAFLLVAALITNNSEIIIPNVGLNPTRISYLDILKSIGANIEIEEVKIIGGEQMGTIRARSSQLEGNVHLDGHQIAGLVDEIPILAVAGAFCNGTFSVRDAEELRTKESDRVKTIVTNLRRMGVEVEEYNDGFAFESKKDLISGCFDSFNDHRIAMAFGVAALALKENSIIQNAGCVEISYPGFWQTVESF